MYLKTVFAKCTLGYAWFDESWLEEIEKNQLSLTIVIAWEYWKQSERRYRTFNSLFNNYIVGLSLKKHDKASKVAAKIRFIQNLLDYQRSTVSLDNCITSYLWIDWIIMILWSVLRTINIPFFNIFLTPTQQPLSALLIYDYELLPVRVPIVVYCIDYDQVLNVTHINDCKW